jgi:hypothetical protein
MKNPKHSTPPTSLVFNHEELVVINNALNEVCNGLSWGDDEFQTRIGYSRTMAQNLLMKVAKTLAKDA